MDLSVSIGALRLPNPLIAASGCFGYGVEYGDVVDLSTLGGVAVKSGRYGAYVTAGGVNATIPSDKTQETITLPEAIALIDERVAKGGGKPKRGAKKAKTAKPAKVEAVAKTPKPAKKAVAKKSAGKPKSDAASKARASSRISRASSSCS